MTSNLIQLSIHDLETLASALRTSRLKPPFSEPAIKRILHGSVARIILDDLVGLSEKGFTAAQIAILLDTLKGARQSSETIDLVTTGPESPGVVSRDTSVVVSDMFAHAATSVLIAGYAVYQGRRVFESLARRMDELPGLAVEMYLDIQRPPGDSRPESLLVKEFATRFETQQWPDCSRLPKVFYDPRALDLAQSNRAWLHAKCVVVDASKVFISSANFTEFGQQKNIEVGVLLRSPAIARQLTSHFKALANAALLKPAIA